MLMMTEKQPLISIIIPVYNGGKYLRPCIDSIVGQTWKNWELLLIDDGSSDGSERVCDEYAANHDNIRAVHKPNGGQASARNLGIGMAKGSFIAFADCDDWLDPDAYEVMMKTLADTGADIVICGYTEEYANRQLAVNAGGELSVLSGADALKQVLGGGIGSYLWSMLFKREVVREPMPDLNPYEDHATIFKWVSHAGKVALLHRAFYHYRQLQNSSLHSYNHRQGNHFFMAIKERYHYVEQHALLPGWERENRRVYLRNCIKLAKDLARSDGYDEKTYGVISEVRDELRRFLPVGAKDIGLKYYVRLKLLMSSISVFVSVLRCTAAFSLSKRIKDKGRV